MEAVYFLAGFAVLFALTVLMLWLFDRKKADASPRAVGDTGTVTVNTHTHINFEEKDEAAAPVEAGQLLMF